MNTTFSARHGRLMSTTVLSLIALTFARASGAAEQPTTRPAETPRVGDAAKDFTLATLDGTPLVLSEQVRKGPVVLIVLRGWPGYQCPLCNKQVQQFIGKAKDFEAAKASVVLVYPGPADNLKAHADEFLKGKTVPANFRLVLDPDYAFVNSYGLRWNAPNETAYPSTFVIDSSNIIRFAKTSHEHGGRASVAEVLAALFKLK